MQYSQFLLSALAIIPHGNSLSITTVHKRSDADFVQVYDETATTTISVNQTEYNSFMNRLAVADEAVAEGALTKRATVPSYPIGCFDDNPNYRTLRDDAIYTDDMTIQECQAYCASKSSTYDIFGLEYGRECYCGSGLRNGLATTGKCDKPCAGDSSTICGGGNTLSVYTTNQALAVSVLSSPSVSQVGCFQDFYGAPTNYRILDGADYSSDSMTMESCSSFCNGRGYAFGGVEYGRECYCGSTLPIKVSTACTMTCSGNAEELCGGPNAINVFQNKFSAPCEFTTPIRGYSKTLSGAVLQNGQEITTLSVSDCQKACVANSACKSIVTSVNYCRLDRTPISTFFAGVDNSSPYGYQNLDCRV